MPWLPVDSFDSINHRLHTNYALLLLHCLWLGAAVAGVMLVLCFTELIPETLENVDAHEAILSNIAGMFLMFVSKTIMAHIQGELL